MGRWAVLRAALHTCALGVTCIALAHDGRLHLHVSTGLPKVERRPPRCISSHTLSAEAILTVRTYIHTSIVDSETWAHTVRRNMTCNLPYLGHLLRRAMRTPLPDGEFRCVCRQRRVSKVRTGSSGVAVGRSGQASRVRTVCTARVVGQ